MFEATDALIPAVEALMRRLVVGERPEITGEVALAHLETGGKRLRARLALAATAALGGDAKQAVGWAAACELLHNATLVHDDLQDGDRLRRGHPTAWVRFGQNQAINAGDLLLMLPFSALEAVEVAPAARAELCRVLARRAADVIRGQAMEMDFTLHTKTDRPSYLAAIEGKTSALFLLPAEGAALVAGRSAAQAVELAAPFAPLGMFFQIQDDILDLFGDKGRGAPGSDIKEGKVSALVVEHLALHPGDEAWLKGILRSERDKTTDAMVAEVIGRFKSGGALAAVLARIREQEALARSAVRRFGEPAWTALVDELLALILDPIKHVMA